MSNIEKRSALFLVLILVVPSLAITVAMPLGKAQSGTNFSGVINSDTSWTNSNSPYNLTGNVLVNNGVTLTIEPGATVNLNSYYLMVNGTLFAKGTSVNKINFNGGSINYPTGITLTVYSSSWNKQTNSGSIIENTVSDSAFSVSCSAKIGNNNLSKGRLGVQSASPNISGNIIGRVGVQAGSPIISNNTINGEIDVGSGSPTITNNTITISPSHNDGGFNFGMGTNYQNYGINLYGDNNAYISDNVISTNVDHAGVLVAAGTPTIQRNVISNSYGYGAMPIYHQAALEIDKGSNALIQNNTIIDSPLGVACYSATFTLIYNNIQGNSYNVYLFSGETSNVNASNNWWGTSDPEAINQAIYDFKNDFTLGTVDFVPFLTSPNPLAPIYTPITLPSPTPSSSASPSPTHAVPEFPVLTTPILLIAILMVAGLLVYFKKKRNHSLIKKV